MSESKLHELLLDSEERVWDAVRGALSGSNCFKTRTAAAVVKYDAATGIYAVLSIGSNSCAPKGCEYGSKLSGCPRMETKAGARYDLCAPLHAERMASLNIRQGRSNSEVLKFASHLDVSEQDIMSAFTAEELGRLNGASLYLVGHYWTCDGCVSFLKTIGITDIKFDKAAAEKTKDSYSKRNIG